MQKSKLKLKKILRYLFLSYFRNNVFNWINKKITTMLSQEKEQLLLFTRKHKTNNNDEIIRDIQSRIFNFLGKDVAVAPVQVELNGSSDSRKELSSPLGCWVLSASVMWACSWQNNILEWVRRMKVVSRRDTFCWVFRL